MSNRNHKRWALKTYPESNQKSTIGALPVHKPIGNVQIVDDPLSSAGVVGSFACCIPLKQSFEEHTPLLGGEPIVHTNSGNRSKPAPDPHLRGLYNFTMIVSG
jgi:hypothetical protein